MAQIVTVENVKVMPYETVLALLHDIYTKEIPAYGINKSPDLKEIEHLMVFFSNQYSYMTELWAVMVHMVRLHKTNKEATEIINEALDKRDYIEKIMSATKIKYYTANTLLQYYSGRKER